MSRKFLVSIDLTKNELQNAVIQNLASAPASPVAGQIYYDTASNEGFIYNGSGWVSLNGVTFGNVTAQTTFGASSSNGTATTVSHSDHTHGTPALPYGSVTAQTTFGASSTNGTSTNLSRADHTHGTPVHDNAAHAGINLSALAAPLSDVSFGNFKITSLADPVNAQDAATKTYVDSVASGLHVHQSAVAATTANLTATYNNGSSGVGATLTNSGTQAALVIDGITLAVSDRVLVKNQTSQLQNGIYVVTNTGSVSTNWVLTRATDFDSTTEIDGGDFLYVNYGTVNAGTSWVETTPAVIVGTTAIVFDQFGGGTTYSAGTGIDITGSVISIDTAVVPRKFAQTLSTSATSYTITHNLGTLDVLVTVYAVADGSEVVVDNLRTNTNTVTLNFNVAPSANAYRVVIIG